MTDARCDFTDITGVATVQCQICEGNHQFWNCDQYKALTLVKKFEFAKKGNNCKLFQLLATRAQGKRLYFM